MTYLNTNFDFIDATFSANYLRVGNICAFYTNASNPSYLQSSEVWQQACNMLRLADLLFVSFFISA